MNLELRIWRQPSADARGSFVTYMAQDISPDMSFLEMLDVVNEGLVVESSEPIAFDHDCREGICGSCGMMINGVAHGPMRATATCQLHMRHFKDADVIWIEPWRSKAFPVVKDLVVNRDALDRVVAAGGFISVNTGSAPEANSLPVPKSLFIPDSIADSRFLKFFTAPIRSEGGSGIDLVRTDVRLTCLAKISTSLSS